MLIKFFLHMQIYIVWPLYFPFQVEFNVAEWIQYVLLLTAINMQ